jgi:CelD/BcsL family acetyltransferase involved in cellulose biosynthesis
MRPPELAELTVSVATSRREAAALAGEWRELWTRCPQATPFQSPDWLLPWWRHFDPGSGRIVCVRDAERLVGVAACVPAGRSGGQAPGLALMGAGVSDYLDVLAAPESEERVVAALWTELLRGSDGRRWLELQPLPLWSTLLRQAVRLEPRVAVEPVEVCPVVSLRAGREEWLPPHWRKKIEYERRRLQRTGWIEIEQASVETRATLLPEVFRLHAARWQRRGQAGVLADGTIRAFHDEVTAGFAAVGALRLYVLRLDGHAVAAYYGFRHGRRAFYYLGGFDPTFERLGVGNQLLDHAMSEAWRERADEFDFLRGQEAYKYHWGAVDQPVFRLTFGGEA